MMKLMHGLFCAVAATLVALTVPLMAAADVIHACQNNNSGAVQIVAETTTCNPNWTKISWNETGPEGPQGEQGVPGVSGYEIVFTECLPVPEPPFHGFDRAFCPDDKKVLGGGVGVYSDDACTVPSGAARVTYSAIEPQFPDLNVWAGDVVKIDDFDNWFHVQAICATVE